MKIEDILLRLDPNFNNDNICASPKVDAIFLTADRSTYVFQGDNYWKLTKDSVAPGNFCCSVDIKSFNLVGVSMKISFLFPLSGIRILSWNLVYSLTQELQLYR